MRAGTTLPPWGHPRHYKQADGGRPEFQWADCLVGGDVYHTGTNWKLRRISQRNPEDQDDGHTKGNHVIKLFNQLLFALYEYRCTPVSV